MIFIWFAVVLLTLAWQPLLGIYQPTHIYYSSPVWISYIFIGLSIPALFLSKKNINCFFSGKRSVLMLLASIIPVILLSFPYNLFGIIIFISFLLFLSAGRSMDHEKSEKINRAGSSFFIVGLVLFFQTITIPGFYLFSSRIHRFDLLGEFINFILKVFGANSSINQGNLVIYSNEKPLTLIASFDAFGLFIFINLLIAYGVIFFLFSDSRRNLLKFPVILLLYMILRYIILILLYLEIEQSNIFWRMDITVLTYIPLILILYWVNKPVKFRNEFETDFNREFWDKKYKVSYISLGLFFIFGVLFWGFSDPGYEKAGRILIDEKHSNWEWTTQKFDTTWYGRKSTYNYYCFAEYMKCYYNVDQKFVELTGELLKNYDILIIKTPTEQFSESEINAIIEFVDRGGGLFLIGDHTNVFGITSNLNTIATRFGVKFRNDGQYDLDGALSVYKKPSVMPHPVVQHMPRMMFATSCMLDIPFLAENALIGYGIKSIALDYAERNFFPENANNNSKMEFGLFAQAAGISFGKGRVFLFTDSTIWSNFFMFIPGKPELLLGIIAWLNRANSILNILRLLSIFLSAFFLFLFIKSTFFGKIKTGRSPVIKMFIINGFIIAPVLIFGISELNRLNYPKQAPIKNFIKVNFDAEHSSYELPVINLVQKNERSYHTFFMWTQRIGLFPSVKKNFMETLSGDASVIINPVIAFRSEELDAIKNYLYEGGKVLILDDPRNSSFFVTNKIIENFGLKVQANGSISDAIMVYLPGTDSVCFHSRYAGEVIGGKTEISVRGINKNILDTNSFKILGYKQIGKGLLAVAANSFTFCDKIMGSSSELPDEVKKKIFKYEFWLFRDLLGLKVLE